MTGHKYKECISLEGVYSMLQGCQLLSQAPPVALSLLDQSRHFFRIIAQKWSLSRSISAWSFSCSSFSLFLSLLEHSNDLSSSHSLVIMWQLNVFFFLLDVVGNRLFFSPATDYNILGDKLEGRHDVTSLNSWKASLFLKLYKDKVTLHLKNQNVNLQNIVCQLICKLSPYSKCITQSAFIMHMSHCSSMQ